MYQVSKYPTLKLFRFGQVMKKEYRGQRSVDAFFNFVRDQLENPVNIVQNLDDLDVLDVSISRVEFVCLWEVLINVINIINFINIINVIILLTLLFSGTRDTWLATLMFKILWTMQPSRKFLEYSGKTANSILHQGLLAWLSFFNLIAVEMYLRTCN